MGKYNGFGNEKDTEPWPLGMVVIDPIKPIVDENGNPIPAEEKTYSHIRKR